MLRRLIQPAASAVSGAARIALGHTHALTVRGRPSGIACVQARWYSASAILRVGDGAGAGGGNGLNNDEPAAAAPAGTKTRVLWVQRAGAKGYAALTATGDADVGDLLEDVLKKLPSLRSVDADRIRLQLAVKEAGGTDKLAALDSMDTIDEALTKALGGAIKPTDKLRVIVDVMAPAVSPLVASVDALRAQAQLLADMRASLKRSSPLANLATLTLGSSGLAALSAGETEAPVSLVQFGVPGIPGEVLVGPRGLEDFAGAGGSVLLEQGRLDLAQEFVKAMTDRAARGSLFGLLLSGPNGIGKSAVGLLSYLACAAQSLPVVYVTRAGDWVTAARAGNGDAFFLRTLLKQNADIVLGDAGLMRVFEPLLRRQDEMNVPLFEMGAAFGGTAASTMAKLLTLVESRRGAKSQPFGVIIDETQKITEAAERENITYFKEGWYGWQYSPGNAFVRMDIASSHGLREFTLGSAEDHRLRFVLPWARGPVMDFLSDKESPGYLEVPATRKRVHYICGGVLRSLFDAKRAVDFHGTTPAALDIVEGRLRIGMSASCKQWMQEASPEILRKCASSIAKLVRGSTPWEDLKPAYDQGLVAFVPQDRTVVPVSSVAASVLHAALAELVRKELKDTQR